ncbi:hypothetical protein [Paraburkholderia sp. 2C]
MNEFAARFADSELPGFSVDIQKEKRFRVIRNNNSSNGLSKSPKTYVSISVDESGRIDFESEVEPRYAERLTDVLLLMLVRAREARKID